MRKKIIVMYAITALYLAVYSVPVLSIETAGKISQTETMSSEVYFRSGLSKARIKDYVGAIADFSKSLEQDNYSVSAYWARGLAKTQIGDFSGAIFKFFLTGFCKLTMPVDLSKTSQ